MKRETETLKTYQIKNPAIKHAMAVAKDLEEALSKKEELEAKILSLRTSLSQHCPHPTVYVTVDDTRIFEGGVWKTETIFTCSLCGKQLRKELRDGTSD